MKKLLFLCICIASTFSAKAQTEDKKWNVGLHGGAIQYHGDLGRDWYKTDKTIYGFGGVSVSRYLWDFLDINASYSRGTLGYDSSVTGYKSDFSAVTLNLRWNMISQEFTIRPYVFGGVGAILFDRQLNFHKEKIDSALPTAGGGINIKLSPDLTLNLQETFLFTNNDRRDGVVSGKNDDYLMHSAGITYSFGKKKDADMDGVSDKKDKCPDTPTGVAVDKMGCPLDKDNDGVADYLDTCPDVAGLKLLNGCPDKDNDGITDANDRCPDQPGTAMLKGCPDTDGDGVADLDDRCPNAKGTIENKGCPEITKQDAVRITYIGSKIFFENNSDKLKVASLSQLDELSKILYKYEGANLTIEGHTDSNGSDASNQTLSQKRTESVKEYLIGKGILETRLTGIGYGETKPVGDNKTSLGRAKNRRVELKTTY